MAKASNIIKPSLLTPYYYLTLLVFFKKVAIPVQMLSQHASSKFLLLPIIGEIPVLLGRNRFEVVRQSHLQRHASLLGSLSLLNLITS